MKVYLTVIFTLLIFQLTAGEVYFVPGWYSKWKNYSDHTETLQNIFPDDVIRIRKWESNKLWKNAKSEAEAYAGTLAKEILGGVTRDVTLIGHSLGGRITLDCVAEFARQKKQIRQVILLGTADEITEEDIKNCRQVSLLPVINIFCVDDNMLKLFLYKEKFYPLGLAGLDKKTEHFEQYRMYVADDHVTLFGKDIISPEVAEPFRETAAHLSPKYLERLREVLNGKVRECYYDLPKLENIAGESAVAPDRLPGFVLLEEFQGWRLYIRRYRVRYRIVSPTGKKFHYTAGNHAMETFSRLKSELSRIEN